LKKSIDVSLFQTEKLSIRVCSLQTGYKSKKPYSYEYGFSTT
jgi:hypothetical protein